MLPGDWIALVMVGVFGAWIAVMARRERGRRLDTVVMKSTAGLIVAGLLFGALAGGVAVYGLSMIASDPHALVDTHRFGNVHGWVMGVVALVVGAIIAYPAVLLLGKAIQIRKRGGEAVPVLVVEIASRGTARFEPAQPTPRVVDLDGARAAAVKALDAATTLDAVSAIARAFLRDGFGAPASGATDAMVAFARSRELHADDWAEVLERIDAARYGGADAEVAQIVARVRELVIS